MKNNKGFTLIEILAAVTILAIISTISVVAVTRYVEKTKVKSYETMVQSVCDAANNYIINEGLESEVADAGTSGVTYDATDLMRDKYLENLMDPNDKERRCGANVNVKLANGATDDDSVSEFSYFVKLRCKRYNSDVGFSHGCIVNSRVTDPGSPEPIIPDPVVNPNPGGGGGTDPDNPDPGGTDPDTPTEGTGVGSSALSCGILKENTVWTSQVPVETKIKCIPNNGNTCQQDVYTRTFYSDIKTDTISIADNSGNAKLCNVNVYIDTSEPSSVVASNPYEDKWINKSYSVSLSSGDNTSGIAYFAYRYPNSSVASEREWHKYANSSKDPGDTSSFNTTNFSKKRNEIVEFIACDYAGNCTEPTTSMIKIDKTAPTCKNGRSLQMTTKGSKITGYCSDEGGSECTTPSVSLVIPEGENVEGVSPGTVYDNAGNSTVCPKFYQSLTAKNLCYFNATTSGVTLAFIDSIIPVASYGMNMDGVKTYNNVKTMPLAEGKFNGYVKYEDGEEISCSTTLISASTTKYNATVNSCTSSLADYNCATNATVSYSCGAGYTLDGTKCTMTKAATEVKLYNKKTSVCSATANNSAFHSCTGISNQNKCSSTNGCSWNGSTCTGTGGYCDSGLSLIGTDCMKYEFKANANTVLTSKCTPDSGACSDSESRNKVTCTYATSTYTCSVGKLNGTKCEITVDATPSYSCSTGTVSGTKCYVYNVSTCPTGFSIAEKNYNYSFSTSVSKKLNSCAVENAFTCNVSTYGKSFISNCELTTSTTANCPKGYTKVGDYCYIKSVKGPIG